MDTKTTALTKKPAPAPTTAIDIELIAVVSPSRRPIDQAAVKRLAESIARQGLTGRITTARLPTTARPSSSARRTPGPLRTGARLTRAKRTTTRPLRIDPKYA